MGEIHTRRHGLGLLSFFLCFCFLGIGATPTASTTKTTLYHANFDDVSAPIPDTPNPFPATYDGLHYKNVNLANESADIAGGVKPQTPPNNLIALATTELLQGPPTLSVDHAGLNTISFSLQQLYFGCTINTAQGVLSPIKLGSSKPITQVFQFKPTKGVLVSPLTKAVFNSAFTNLVNATLLQSPEATTALALDSFVYTTISPK